MSSPINLNSNKRPFPFLENEGNTQKKQKIVDFHEVIINGLAFSEWGEEIPKISADTEPSEKRFGTIIEYLHRCFSLNENPLLKQSITVTGKCFRYYKQLDQETKKIYEVAYQRLIQLPVAFIYYNNAGSPTGVYKAIIYKLAEISQFFESKKNTFEFSINISQVELRSVIELINNEQRQQEFFESFNSFFLPFENLKLLGILLEFEIESFSSKALTLLISQVRNQIFSFYEYAILDTTTDLRGLFLISKPWMEKLAEIDDQVFNKAKQAENELLFAEVKAFLIASQTKRFDFETSKLILLKLIGNLANQAQSFSVPLAKEKILIQTTIEVLLTELWTTHSTDQTKINEQVNDLLKLCKPLNLKFFKLNENNCFTLSLELNEKIKEKCLSKELTESQYKENEELYKEILEIPSLTIGQFGFFISLLINPTREEDFFTNPTIHNSKDDLQVYENLLNCAIMFQCENFINKIGIKVASIAEWFTKKEMTKKKLLEMEDEEWLTEPESKTELLEIGASIKSKIYDKIPHNQPLKGALGSLFGNCPFDDNLIKYLNKENFDELSLSTEVSGKIPKEIKHLEHLKILTISGDSCIIGKEYISYLKSLEKLYLCCDADRNYRGIFAQIKNLPIKHLTLTNMPKDDKDAWKQLCNSGLQIESLKIAFSIDGHINNWQLIENLPLKKLTINSYPPLHNLEFTKVLANHPTLPWHSICLLDNAPSYEDIKQPEDTEEEVLIRLADWYAKENCLMGQTFFYLMHYHKFDSAEVKYKLGLFFMPGLYNPYRDLKTAKFFLQKAADQGHQEAQQQLDEIKQSNVFPDNI